MRIALAADHAGFVLKDELAAWLREQGHEVSDLGTNAKRIQDFLTLVQRLASYDRSAMSTDFKLTPRAEYVHVELAASARSWAAR